MWHVTQAKNVFNMLTFEKQGIHQHIDQYRINTMYCPVASSRNEEGGHLW